MSSNTRMGSASPKRKKQKKTLTLETWGKVFGTMFMEIYRCTCIPSHTTPSMLTMCSCRNEAIAVSSAAKSKRTCTLARGFRVLQATSREEVTPPARDVRIPGKYTLIISYHYHISHGFISLNLMERDSKHPHNYTNIISSLFVIFRIFCQLCTQSCLLESSTSASEP